MLQEIGNYPEGAKAEICKPDYEKLIRENKERLELNLNLKNALFAYIGIGRISHVNDRLAEIIGELVIGELVIEEKVIENNIDILIKEQEAQG